MPRPTSKTHSTRHTIELLDDVQQALALALTHHRAIDTANAAKNGSLTTRESPIVEQLSKSVWAANELRDRWVNHTLEPSDQDS